MGSPVSAARTNRPRTDVGAAIERYFQVSLFLLITTGFATLISTGRLDPLSVLFVGIALVIRAYLLLKQREIKIPERWTNYFTLLYVLVFVVDLFMISGSYVTASIHLVLFSLVVKLFSVQRERDYVYLALLAFLAVLAASVLTVDTMFLGTFVAFVVLAVNTFVSMEIRRSMKKAAHYGRAPADREGSRRLGFLLSGTGGIIVLGIVLISAALFFVLPRFSAGYLSGYAPHSDLVTGFSDHVNLGAIGRIQQTDNVVMHVQMDSPAPPDLKWRGVALNAFDGQTWKNDISSPGDEPEDIRSYSGRYTIRRLEMDRHNLPAVPQDAREFRLIRYRIVMEPIGTDVIFLASVPLELDGRFRSISVDGNGSVTNIDRSQMTESYEAISHIMEPSLDTLRSKSGEYPPEISAADLKLPDMDSRVQELAQQITENAGTDYDKAIQIEQYLREHYSYTLQLPSQTPKDPIANFLFVRKAGHCEYFASSMAVMLRMLGIPSRLVNGFRNGEYNDLTGNYIVRARNAHTWVEAYIPSVGWTSFDPTPGDPAPVVNSFSRMRLYLDAAQEFWREWIINYDFGHQRELTLATVSKAQRSAFDLRRWLRKQYFSLLKRARKINNAVASNPRKWVVLGVFVALGIFGLWNSQRLMRIIRQRSIARSPSKAPQIAASIWYTRMLKSVARRGYSKPPAQTPEEFARAIPEPALRDSVFKFTERYERARFGDSAEDAEQLPELFEEIAAKK